jgi:hypothetical protein
VVPKSIPRAGSGCCAFPITNIISHRFWIAEQIRPNQEQALVFGTIQLQSTQSLTAPGDMFSLSSVPWKISFSKKLT